MGYDGHFGPVGWGLWVWHCDGDGDGAWRE